MGKKRVKNIKKCAYNGKIPWSEWSDEIINAEQLEIQKPIMATKKSSNLDKRKSLKPDMSDISTKLFKDSYPVPLPPSLGKKHIWIRTCDYMPHIKQVLYGKGVSIPVDLVSRNEHLLHSEFVRAVISAIHSLTYLGHVQPFIVEWETPVFSSNTSGQPWQPWHHIYSRCGAGRAYHHIPQLNTLGKYAVRLFWMGCWRNVIVDDYWPINKYGKLLLPVSNYEPDLELWPLLLTKALYKLGSLTWRPGRELNQFDVISCLTGWIYRRIDTTLMEPMDMWYTLQMHAEHFVYPDDKSIINVGGKKQKKASPPPPPPPPPPPAQFLFDAVDESPANYLFIHCSNMRHMEEKLIEEVTPCLNHPILLVQTRDVPLIKPGSDPSRILPAWKKIRWEDWAASMGLWVKDEPPEKIKYLKVVSMFRRQYDPVSEAVVSMSTMPTIPISASASCTITTRHTGFFDTGDLERLFRSGGGSDTQLHSSSMSYVLEGKNGIMNITLPKSKTDKDTTSNQKSTTKIDATVDITYSPQIHKLNASIKNKMKMNHNINDQFEDPSVWCNFYKLYEHIKSISLYYKPKKYKMSAIVTNLELSTTSKVPIIETNKKKDNKDDKNNKKNVKNNTIISNKNSTTIDNIDNNNNNNNNSKNKIGNESLVKWKRISRQEKRKPFYLFIDSVKPKDLLISLSVVGSEMPTPPKRPCNLKHQCPKLKSKNSECVEKCKCEGRRKKRWHWKSRVKSTQRLNRIHPIYTTQLQFLKCSGKRSWQEEKNRLVNIRTYGENNILLRVDKGRHIFTIWLKSRRSYVLRILSQTHFIIGDFTDIIRPMTHESKLLKSFCKGIAMAFAKLIQNFGTNEYSSSLIEFYQSYKPIVPLNKQQSIIIHNLFFEKFLQTLRCTIENEQMFSIMYALRVLFLNPNIKTGKIEPKIFYKYKLTDSKCKCVDPIKIEQEDRAARIIQNFFKMVHVKKLKLLQNRDSQKFSEIINNLLEIYSMMFCRPVCRSLIIEIFRKLHRDNDFKKLNSFYPFTNDLNKIIKLKKFDGYIKRMKKNEWTPITNIIFHCKSKSLMQINMHIVCKLPLFRIRVFNNDTLKEFGTFINQTINMKCKKNIRGYTAVVYGWNGKKKLKERTPWHIYMTNTKRSFSIPLTTKCFRMKKKLVAGNYLPNAQNLISRCIVKVGGNTPAQFRFRTSSKDVQILLRLFDKNGRLLNSASGRGTAIIPLVFLKKKPCIKRKLYKTTNLFKSKIKKSNSIKEKIHNLKTIQARTNLQNTQHIQSDILSNNETKNKLESKNQSKFDINKNGKEKPTVHSCINIQCMPVQNNEKKMNTTSICKHHLLNIIKGNNEINKERMKKLYEQNNMGCLENLNLFLNKNIEAKRTESLLQQIDDIQDTGVRQSIIGQPKLSSKPKKSHPSPKPARPSNKKTNLNTTITNNNTTSNVTPSKLSTSKTLSKTQNNNSIQKIDKKSSLINNQNDKKQSLIKSKSLLSNPISQKGSVYNDKFSTIIEEMNEYYIEAYVMNNTWPLTKKEWNVVKQIRSLYNVEHQVLVDMIDKGTQTYGKISNIEINKNESNYKKIDETLGLEECSTFSTKSIDSIESFVDFESLTKWVTECAKTVDVGVNTIESIPIKRKTESSRKIDAPRKSLNNSKLNKSTKVNHKESKDIKEIKKGKEVKKLKDIKEDKKFQEVKTDKSSKNIKRIYEKPFWTLNVTHAAKRLVTLQVDNEKWENLKRFKLSCFKGKPQKYIRAKRLREEFLNEFYIRWPGNNIQSNYDKTQYTDTNSIKILLSPSRTRNLHCSNILNTKSSSLVDHTKLLNNTDKSSKVEMKQSVSTTKTTRATTTPSNRHMNITKSNEKPKLENVGTSVKTNEKPHSKTKVKKQEDCRKCKKQVPDKKVKYLSPPDEVNKMLPPFTLDDQVNMTSIRRKLTAEFPQDMYNEIKEKVDTCNKKTEEAREALEEYTAKVERQTIATREWYSNIRSNAEKLIEKQSEEMTKYVQNLKNIEEQRAPSKRKPKPKRK